MAGRLYGVGVGPGDPELVTLKALRLMRECEIIAVTGENPKESAAYRIAETIYPEVAGKELLHLVTPMTKDREVLEAGYRASADAIEQYLKEGKSVALLTLGDPSVYSSFIYIKRLVQADGYETKMISGVPSFCAAAAEIGDSLADRNEQIHVIPASYRIEEAMELEGTKVLMKSGSKLADVKELLQKRNYQACMIENCGMPDERIYPELSEFPEKGSYYSIMIVKEP